MQEPEGDQVGAVGASLTGREVPATAGVSEVPPAPTTEIEAFARQYRPFLEGLAKRLCRNAYDPDDLVQDVLERVVKSFVRRPEADARSWLARIAHNRFIDLVRRRQSKPVHQPYDDDQASETVASSATWEQVTIEQVQTSAAELPNDLREVYECHAVLNLSYTEIATRLDIPKGTVGTRLQRARRRLRELLLGGGEDGSND